MSEIDAVTGELLDTLERTALASIERSEQVLVGCAAIRLRLAGAELVPAAARPVVGPTCPLCDGEGVIGGLVVGDDTVDERCAQCGGSGRVSSAKIVKDHGGGLATGSASADDVARYHRRMQELRLEAEAAH